MVRETSLLGRIAIELTHYDLVLAIIPIGFLLAGLLGTLLSLPAHAVMAAGSLVGVLALLDALFLAPPVDRDAG